MAKRRHKAPQVPDDPSVMQPLHPAVNFVPRQMNRHDLVSAPYNPRTITKDAWVKLRDFIGSKDYGLLEPLVWNERTKTLVGGHQRLSCLDDLAQGKPYSLHMAVVDMAPDQEKVANLALNNPNLQGAYDTDQLAQWQKDGFNFEAAGFNSFDLEVMFPADLMEGSTFGSDSDTAAGKAATSTAERTAAEIAEIKKRKREYKERDLKENDGRFMLVLIFPDSEVKAKFLERFGWSPEMQYFDGKRVLAAVEESQDNEGG